MEQLTRWNGARPLAQRFRYEFDRGIDRALAIAELAAFMVPKLGHLFWLFGNMVVTSLGLSQEDIAAARAGTLSPHKLAAHFHRRAACKHELLDLLERFNETVHRLIEP